MLTSFEGLPDSARVWVYGVDRDLDKSAESVLLGEVDSYLTTWTAHGTPLNAGRHWRDGRFLTVAVDQNRAGASGCSIDGLFRALKQLEGKIGAGVVTSGLVFFRGKDGRIRSVTRDEFSEMGAKGEVSGETEVFDPSVTSLGEWRARFSSRASDSWHGSLLPTSAG
ncbi:MAG TPA: hypothetical protein VJB15_06715 [Rhodothermia bacterium]|nr:hypothetical protein [Rhodothermia bacterium]